MTKSRVRIVLEMIKFEHSVFALPFALVGALLAARAGGALPNWRQILWIVVAMVGARSAAMTMNRIADLKYDARNPRTANRALPKGELSVGFAWMFTLIASALLVLAARQLNPLALKLSPVALAILFFYSYTKRFTSWSHFVLGFCLGISPAAAWIAIRGSLRWRLLVLFAPPPLRLSRHFPSRRLDRDSRLARLAHADSLRRRHLVGGRLRRALRLPGCGLRPDRWSLFHSEKIRRSPSALNCACNAHRDGRIAGLAGP